MIYEYTCAECEMFIGEKEHDDLRDIQKSTQWAYRGNVGTFLCGYHCDCIRITEKESGKVVGWFDNPSGKFIPRQSWIIRLLRLGAI